MVTVNALKLKMQFDSGRLLTNLMRWSQDQRTIRYVTLLLIIWLAYLAAGLTWRLMPGAETLVQTVPVMTQQATGTEQATARQAPNIARWHLFGQTIQPSAAPERREVMPETKLNLTLRGVIAAEDPADSGAIIAAANREERYYPIDAELPGGAVLKEVYADHVVLLRGNERYETLPLPRDALDQSAMQSPEMSPTAQGSLREYRETLINNPEKLADFVRMTQVPVAGGTGYQLLPGRDRGLFERSGLQAGDIVTAVDGVPLDNAANLLNVGKLLSEKSEVQLDVLRNGVHQSLTINVDQ